MPSPTNKDIAGNLGEVASLVMIDTQMETTARALVARGKGVLAAGFCGRDVLRNDGPFPFEVFLSESAEMSGDERFPQPLMKKVGRSPVEGNRPSDSRQIALLAGLRGLVASR